MAARTSNDKGKLNFRLCLSAIFAAIGLGYLVFATYNPPDWTPGVVLAFGLSLGLSACFIGGDVSLDLKGLVIPGSAVAATGGVAFLIMGLLFGEHVVERFADKGKPPSGWLVDEEAIAAQGDRNIRIGAKNFPESNILCELVAHHLRTQRGGNGKVDVLNSYGSSRALMAALVTGDIDIYIDYTGTLLAYQLGLAVPRKEPCWKECNESQLRSLLVKNQLPRWGRMKTRIEPVCLLGYSSNFEVVVARDFYEKTIGTLNNGQARRLSDWIPGVLDERPFGATEEFMRRPDGLRDLVTHYKGQLNNLDVRKLDSGKDRYNRLETQDIYWTDGFSTDPECFNAAAEGSKFVKLVDDAEFWPEYAAVVLSRTGFLDKNPRIRAGLRELEGKVTLDEVVLMVKKARDKRLDFDELAAMGKYPGAMRRTVDEYVREHYKELCD